MEPTANQQVIVLEGLSESRHEHPRNQEECAADVVTHEIKRKAEQHLEQPPA